MVAADSKGLQKGVVQYALHRAALLQNITLVASILLAVSP
jgi:hypothetical protein